MPAKPLGVFRGDCVGYYLFEVDARDLSALEAFCVSDNRTLRLPAVELPDPRIRTALSDSATAVVALVFPLIAGRERCEIRLEAKGRRLFGRTLSATALKWESRASYRMKAELAQALGSVADACSRTHPSVGVVGVYPLDEERLVCRFEVAIPSRLRDRTWSVSARADGVDLAGRLVELPCESGRAGGTGEDAGARTVFSATFDRTARTLLVAVQDQSASAPGFALGLTPDDLGVYLERFYRLSGDVLQDASYPQWFAARRAQPAELARQRETRFAFEPLISIVMPVFESRVDYLVEAIGSVVGQTYPRWELVVINASPQREDIRELLASFDSPKIRVIELGENRGIAGNTNAGIRETRGDFIGFLDHDDVIEPDCLLRYVEALQDAPDAGLLYCDEDNFTERGTAGFRPWLKPDFNRDLLYTHNYILHFLVVSRAVIEQVRLSGDEVSGAQDFDLTLKAIEATERVVHVPHVLYHWREHADSTNGGNNEAKPYTVDGGRRALEQHFARRGLAATVRYTGVPVIYEPRYAVQGNPLVNVVVTATRGGRLLSRCLGSIARRTGRLEAEFTLAVPSHALDRARGAAGQTAPGERVRIVDCGDGASFAQLANRAVRQTAGEYLLVLDEGALALDDGLIATLAGYLTRPEVGIVGPLVEYPDGLIRFAGIALMDDGRFAALNRNHSLAMNKGYLGNSSCNCAVSAVPAVCQMMRRATFDQVNGYSEGLSQQHYAGIDLCWKAREAGFDVVYTPATRVRHDEPLEDAGTSQAEGDLGRMRALWPERFAGGDETINPNCSKASPYFKLG